jgi:hypothetical protein
LLICFSDSFGRWEKYFWFLVSSSRVDALQHLRPLCLAVGAMCPNAQAKLKDKSRNFLSWTLMVCTSSVFNSMTSREITKLAAQGLIYRL